MVSVSDEPIGWNIFVTHGGGIGQPAPVDAERDYRGYIPRLGDETFPTGEMLHALLSPPTQAGPPYVHTFTLPKPSEPTPESWRSRLLGVMVSLWLSRCRWHLGPHFPVGYEYLPYSLSGPGVEPVRSMCGKQIRACGGLAATASGSLT